MKKTDVKNMIDGISDVYINEATERAAEGGTKTETPLLFSKRGILALASVAAVTAVVVGLVIREAFPKDIRQDPADSQTETDISQTDPAETTVTSVTTAATTAVTSVVTKILPIVPESGKNILGGTGDLVPIGKADTNYDLFLRDDSYYYTGYTNGIRRCALQADSGKGKDRIAFPTVLFTDAGTDLSLLSDEKNLYIEYENALWQTDSFGNAKLLLDYEQAVTDESSGSQALLSAGFHTTAVRYINEETVMIFGSDSRNRSYAFLSQPSTRMFMTETENGLGELDIDGAYLTAYEPDKMYYRFSDQCVWFLNQKGTLTKADYSQPEFVIYSFYNNFTTDTFTVWMEHSVDSWNVCGNKIFYLQYQDDKDYYFCYDTETGETAKLPMAGNIEQASFSEDVLYTLEYISSGSDVGEYAVRRYNLRDPFGSEPVTVLTVPSYCSYSGGQFGFLFSLANSDADTLHLSVDNKEYIIRSDNGTMQNAEVMQCVSETAEPDPVGIILMTNEMCFLRINYSPKNQFTYFSPQYRIYNADTGKELPSDASASNPPTAWRFPEAADEQYYPRAVYGNSNLFLRWADSSYGTLAAGNYEIRLTVYDEEKTPRTISVPFTIDSEDNVLVYPPSNHEAITVKIKEGTLSEDGCTLILTNISGTAQYYSESFALTDTISQTQLTTKAEPAFPEIAHELSGHSSAEYVLDWTEYYGSVTPFQYLLRFTGTNPPVTIYIDKAYHP